MTQLAIIDLDGVVADATARFAKAETIKQEYIAKLVEPEAQHSKNHIADIYWRAVFNPENVPLDTLIEGAKEALETLRYDQSYIIMFMTSRPETMRKATIQWLFERNILFYITNGNVALIMKPPAAQYVKTIAWKALTIQMLVALYGADDVLVVDDEPANLGELMKYDTAHWRLCSSLAEVVAPPPESDVNLDEHPF